MQPPESERTLSYVPKAGDIIRYSLSVPVLMVTFRRGSWLLAIALVAGAGWWAVIGILRHQSDWWLGFAISVVAVISVGLVFAVAVYLRELRSPSYPQGRPVTSVLTSELVTFDMAAGSQRILRSDIDRLGQAFGFVLLGVSSRSVFWIVPR